MARELVVYQLAIEKARRIARKVVVTVQLSWVYENSDCRLVIESLLKQLHSKSLKRTCIHHLPVMYVITFHEPFMDLNIITNVGKSHYCLTHNTIKFFHH